MPGTTFNSVGRSKDLSSLTDIENKMHKVLPNPLLNINLKQAISPLDNKSCRNFRSFSTLKMNKDNQSENQFPEI